MDKSNWINRLYYGDNLNILRDFIPDESIDLIYLDPPFNSKATYNLLFKEKDGKASGLRLKRLTIPGSGILEQQGFMKSWCLKHQSDFQS